jgi:hypothetical protein
MLIRITIRQPTPSVATRENVINPDLNNYLATAEIGSRHTVDNTSRTASCPHLEPSSEPRCFAHSAGVI